MFDDSFEKLRSEVSNYHYNKNKVIIENWCNECGMNEPVGYYNDLSKHELTIYTTKCGIMIGKAGKHIDAVKKVLKKEFNHDYEIKFIEIKGHIVNISKCEKSQLQCSLCNENIENDEEILWGHIQMKHEEKFKEIQNLDSPDMIEEYYINT